MNVTELYFEVRDEEATLSEGTIMKLSIRIQEVMIFEQGPLSTNEMKIDFERDSADEELRWEVCHTGTEDGQFSNHHLLYVDASCDFIEDEYGISVDSGLVRRTGSQDIR